MQNLVMYELAEVARILSLSRQTVLKWLKNGRFPNARKEGEAATDAWLLPASDVERVRRERVRDLEEQRARIEDALQRIADPVNIDV